MSPIRDPCFALPIQNAIAHTYHARPNCSGAALARGCAAGAAARGPRLSRPVCPVGGMAGPRGAARGCGPEAAHNHGWRLALSSSAIERITVISDGARRPLIGGRPERQASCIKRPRAHACIYYTCTRLASKHARRHTCQRRPSMLLVLLIKELPIDRVSAIPGCRPRCGGNNALDEVGLVGARRINRGRGLGGSRLLGARQGVVGAAKESGQPAHGNLQRLAVSRCRPGRGQRGDGPGARRGASQQRCSRRHRPLSSARLRRGGGGREDEVDGRAGAVN